LDAEIPVSYTYVTEREKMALVFECHNSETFSLYMNTISYINMLIHLIQT